MMVGHYPTSLEKISGGVEAVTNSLVPALLLSDQIERLVLVSFHAVDNSIKAIGARGN